MKGFIINDKGFPVKYGEFEENTKKFIPCEEIPKLDFENGLTCIRANSDRTAMELCKPERGGSSVSITVKQNRIRAKRNSLLSQTDKYLLEDYPIPEEQRLQVREYRQLLRDITNKKSFIDDGEIVWPDGLEF